jgi:transposase
MRSAVARSKTHWAAVATNTTRSIRSADDSATASNTSPRSSRPKISRCLDVGDPREEVNITWQCYQEPRSVYHAASAKGRQIAIKVLNSFHTCPIPEVARLGRTLRAWKAQILAYFDTSGVSNGGTEAINLTIEKVRRADVSVCFSLICWLRHITSGYYPLHRLQSL